MLNFIDPVTAINVIAANVPTIYQPLILQCNATVVRGNTNVVDIIWTTGNTQVRRVNNVTASSNIDLLSSYSDSFIIPSMNVSDIGSVYECEVLINSASPTTRKTDFIIPIPGISMYVCAYILQCISYMCMYVSIDVYVHTYAINSSTYVHTYTYV